MNNRTFGLIITGIIQTLLLVPVLWAALTFGIGREILTFGMFWMITLVLQILTAFDESVA